jgi:hypothetical protein
MNRKIKLPVKARNDELKNRCYIEQTRHRCFASFTRRLLLALVAYDFLPEKPSPNLEIIDMKILQAFARVERALVKK